MSDCHRGSQNIRITIDEDDSPSVRDPSSKDLCCASAYSIHMRASTPHIGLKAVDPPPYEAPRTATVLVHPVPRSSSVEDIALERTRRSVSERKRCNLIKI